jgi:hypothetical protein
MILRKSIILCTILFCMPVSAFCMDFAIGVKGGIGFPFFSGTDYQDFLDFATTAVEEYGTYYRTRFMLSYSLGAFVEIGIFNFLSIQPEAIFSWGGGAYGYPENYYLYDYKEYIRTTYLELPVLLKIRMTRNAGTTHWRRYTLFAGPGIALKLSDGKVKGKVDGEDYMSDELPHDYLTDRYYFLLFGIGLDFSRGSQRTFTTVELRYNMGWDSIIHTDLGLDDFKENNIQLLLGFAFGTGPRS